jgi:hypothetical protein
MTVCAIDDRKTPTGRDTGIFTSVVVPGYNTSINDCVGRGKDFRRTGAEDPPAPVRSGAKDPVGHLRKSVKRVVK